jgi:hypothetical protein
LAALIKKNEKPYQPRKIMLVARRDWANGRSLNVRIGSLSSMQT